MAVARTDILDAIASMTVLELSQLIKEMEEKFGVSAAAAAVAVAAPAGGARRAGRRGADRVHRPAHRRRRQQGERHQGRPCRDRPRPQGGQGPGRRRAEAGQGGHLQGRCRGAVEADRRSRRQGGAEVTRRHECRDTRLSSGGRRLRAAGLSPLLEHARRCTAAEAGSERVRAASAPRFRPLLQGSSPGAFMTAATYTSTEKKRIRKSFAKRHAVLNVPFLLATQLESYTAVPAGAGAAERAEERGPAGRVHLDLPDLVAQRQRPPRVRELCARRAAVRREGVPAARADLRRAAARQGPPDDHGQGGAEADASRR